MGAWLDGFQNVVAEQSLQPHRPDDQFPVELYIAERGPLGTLPGRPVARTTSPQTDTSTIDWLAQKPLRRIVATRVFLLCAFRWHFVKRENAGLHHSLCRGANYFSRAPEKGPRMGAAAGPGLADRARIIYTYFLRIYPFLKQEHPVQCQSVHFNRIAATVPKCTGSVRA